MTTPIRTIITHLPIIISLLLSACKTSDGNVAEKWYPCKEDVIWWAVREVECPKSDPHYPKCYFKESSGDYSYGMYGLSLIDARIYQCAFKDKNDIFNQQKSEDCKNKIVLYLKTRYPFENFYSTLGRYWSEFRRKQEWGEDNPSYVKFQSYVALRGCRL